MLTAHPTATPQKIGQLNKKKEK